MTGYLPLIQKDSSTHMHGLAVHVKEGLPFTPHLFPENSADSLKNSDRIVEITLKKGIVPQELLNYEKSKIPTLLQLKHF